MITKITREELKEQKLPFRLHDSQEGVAHDYQTGEVFRLTAGQLYQLPTATCCGVWRAGGPDGEDELIAIAVSW